MSTNLGISAAKRHSLCKKDKAAPGNGEMVDETKSEISIMRIQPKEDFDSTDIEGGSERKRNNSQEVPKKESQELVSVDPLECDTASRPEPTATNDDYLEESQEKKQITGKKTYEEAESISNASTKSMLERAIQKVAKEDEDRDMNACLPEASNYADVKIDPPSEIHAAATREGQPAESFPENHQNLELSTSDRTSEIVTVKDEKSMEFPEDPSGRGQRSPSPPIMKQMTSEEASRKSNSAAQTQERETVRHDEKFLTNSEEIIDVISIDDQDSWTPGSRNDIDHLGTKIGDNRHQQSQNPLRSNDPSSESIPLSSSKTDDHQNDRPITANASTVNELWIEEEAKLSLRTSLNRATSSTSKDLAAAQSAEELWNEERIKLQTISDGIFDDPETREAFLSHRQRRLRDKAIIMRSQSRRQKLEEALKDKGREDSLSKKPSKNKSESMNLGRNRPSPEFYSVIKQSRSKSRDQSLARNSVPFQQGSGDPLNVVSLPSRSKDLIAIRSIEEGQRIRSSKRDAAKHTIVSHHKSNMQSREGRSSSRVPYDEHSNPSHHQPHIDLMIKSLSQQRSRSRDPIGRKSLVNLKDSTKKYLLNDERDDQESLPSIHPVESRPIAATAKKNWSGYDTAISATKELRKLEKKIERQLRRADVDSQTDQSKEIRRMEKKLSKKLRSIIKSDDKNTQKMSSRDIRRLEKHLTQTLSGEDENRASKLKRIKSKGASSSRGPVSSLSTSKEKRQQFAQVSSSHSGQNDRQQSSVYVTTHSPPDKPFLQKSQDNRPDRSMHENSKSLRSRYVRRGIGRRSYSRVTDTND